MCNRDQLTWQMEVTGVTGRTWTCGGNGGGIKYIADVRAMWWLLSLQTEGRNWNVTRGSCMIMCFLNGTFISNIQITMLEALLCHHAYFMEIRKHTGNCKSLRPQITATALFAIGFTLECRHCISWFLILPQTLLLCLTGGLWCWWDDTGLWQ